MESYEIVEAFEGIWPVAPKNVALTLPDGDGAVVSLYAHVEGLMLRVGFDIDRQGTVHNTVVAIDPSQRVVADRLVTSYSTAEIGGHGTFISLFSIRTAVNRVPPHNA